MVIADRGGLPVALSTGQAQPHETRFVPALLRGRFTVALPVLSLATKPMIAIRLIGSCRPWASR